MHSSSPHQPITSQSGAVVAVSGVSAQAELIGQGFVIVAALLALLLIIGRGAGSG
jgi:hypothetical protein